MRKEEAIKKQGAALATDEEHIVMWDIDSLLSDLSEAPLRIRSHVKADTGTVNFRQPGVRENNGCVKANHSV